MMLSMDALTTLIEQENAKLRILEAKVAAARNRIQTLKAMQSGDDFDVLLAGKVAPAAQPEAQTAATPPNPFHREPPKPRPVAVAGQASDAPAEPPRRKKGEVKLMLLSLMSRTTSKRAAELVQEMEILGYRMLLQRMRGDLWAMKKEGLLESEEDGLFRLTEQGEAYVERRKGESPGGAGLSSATTSVADLV